MSNTTLPPIPNLTTFIHSPYPTVSASSTGLTWQQRYRIVASGEGSLIPRGIKFQDKRYTIQFAVKGRSKASIGAFQFDAAVNNNYLTQAEANRLFNLVKTSNTSGNITKVDRDKISVILSKTWARDVVFAKDVQYSQAFAANIDYELLNSGLRSGPIKSQQFADFSIAFGVVTGTLNKAPGIYSKFVRFIRGEAVTMGGTKFAAKVGPRTLEEIGGFAQKTPAWSGAYGDYGGFIDRLVLAAKDINAYPSVEISGRHYSALNPLLYNGITVTGAITPLLTFSFC